jgi:hypothetical protein
MVKPAFLQQAKVTEREMMTIMSCYQDMVTKVVNDKGVKRVIAYDADVDSKKTIFMSSAFERQKRLTKLSVPLLKTQEEMDNLIKSTGKPQSHWTMEVYADVSGQCAFRTISSMMQHLEANTLFCLDVE